MSRWKVLVSAPYAMPIIERYRAELAAAGCDVIVPDVHERLDEADLLPLVADVHGIICGDDRITSRVLDAAPNLRVISKWGTGIDSIDRAAAAARGVALRNTPNAFSEPVADTALGYALVFARQLDRMTADMRAGIWNKPQLTALGECTLGIVGVGNCGRAVACRAKAFGMRILGTDIQHIPAAVMAETGLLSVPLEELLGEADFVTLHTDLNPTSHHLINAKRLRRMKPSAYLINTSRGPVVDEKALIDALRERAIAGAALDVFEEEPLPPDSPLRGFPNVLLAPHSANSGRAAAERVHMNTIRNLIAELAAPRQ
jgi:phosphoglycerate dehydrogenase-like enzyme